MYGITKLVKENVKDTSHVKIAQNKTHMGPVSEEKVRKAKAKALSAAANKVRVLADFTIKVASSDEVAVEKKSMNVSSLVTQVGSTPTQIAQDALYLMQAWDNVFSEEGTPDYLEKSAQAVKARGVAYQQLGINPTQKVRPDLSAEQRRVYNSIVGQYSFDYYEYHLAFKLEGQKKFVRSKTYRSLRPIEHQSIINKLNEEVLRLQKQISVSSKQTN